MFALARRYPFFSYGVGMLLVALAVAMPVVGFGLQYDDGGFGSAAFAFSYIWALLAFPYSITSEVLVSAFPNLSTFSQLSISAVVGLATFAAAELVWQMVRRRRA